MTQFEPAVWRLAHVLLAGRWSCATAESCTGGLLAAACTSVAGSSEWFERGFVTYSNESKSEMLGVEPSLIVNHGAVSAEVATAMAVGALARARAEFAVSVTGIAGPAGGTADKPVGTVWMALSRRHDETLVERLQLTGTRSQVREQTVHHALARLWERASAGR